MYLLLFKFLFIVLFPFIFISFLFFNLLKWYINKFKFIYKFLFIYCYVALLLHVGFCLVVVSGRLLIAVAPLFVEHEL